MRHPGNTPVKRRATALFLAIFGLFFLFFVRLFQVQIVDGEQYRLQTSKGSESKISTSAARGEIFDRYMRPMAVNRASFSITFDYYFFPRGNANQEQINKIILSLTSLLSAQERDWCDTLPITDTEPFEFLPDRENSIAALKSFLRLADYSTAGQCVAKLAKTYGLEGFTTAQQRIAGGVRYEMKVRDFGAYTTSFTFSNNVPETVRNVILENNMDFPGVTISPTPLREYVAGQTGSHLLGTIGPIYEEEYAKLKDEGYRLNDILGKSGIEQAMEPYLRGTAGETVVRRDSGGNVIEREETIVPAAGNSLVLTLDMDLQQLAQDKLDEMIKNLRARPIEKGGSVKSGSVVMLDMTGGVLVCATWPNYNLSTYNADYNALISDPDKPLFNRALNGAYPCGSVIKPGIALAALTEGTVTPASAPYFCSGTGSYRHWTGLPLNCLGHHGNVSCVTAISKSCNVFFYETGRLLGIDKLTQYCTAYGLGQKTGIEVGESAGLFSNPANNKARGIAWNPADVSLVSIGQSANQFTPLQLAAYTMTLANDGVRYKTHLVKSIRTYDGTEIPYDPVIEANANPSQAAIDTVRQGMVSVAKTGTAAWKFASAPYSVAAKTGTPQAGIKGVSEHSSFIAYAPAENPEVAIAVFFEHGNSSPIPSTDLARVMLDAYFSSKTTGQAPIPEGELLD